MADKPITRTDLDDLLTKRENAILRWRVVQLALLSAFGGLIVGEVYFIVANAPK